MIPVPHPSAPTGASLRETPTRGAGSSAACSSCGASHGTTHKQLGQTELALDPLTVSAARRTVTGGCVVVCRRCGHATLYHRVGALRTLTQAA